MRKGHRFIKSSRRKVAWKEIMPLMCITFCVIVILGLFVFNCIIYPAIKHNSYSSSVDQTQESEVSTVPVEMKAEKTTSSVDRSNILLVNRHNFIDKNYVPELKELPNGLQVSSECWGYLVTMLGACETQGMNPVVCSAYRSYFEQEELFNAKVDELLLQYGYTYKEAYSEAQKSVALPGTSEHQLGLAVDIVDINNQNLEEYQENTPTQIWLINNSWKYGFILRYPCSTQSITGIEYEPWHYRFVGIDAAREIHEASICLEQYLQDN